jgi:hypothetical protein
LSTFIECRLGKNLPLRALARAFARMCDAPLGFPRSLHQSFLPVRREATSLLGKQPQKTDAVTPDDGSAWAKPIRPAVSIAHEWYRPLGNRARIRVSLAETIAMVAGKDKSAAAPAASCCLKIRFDDIATDAFDDCPFSGRSGKPEKPSLRKPAEAERRRCPFSKKHARAGKKINPFSTCKPTWKKGCACFRILQKRNNELCVTVVESNRQRNNHSYS